MTVKRGRWAKEHLLLKCLRYLINPQTIQIPLTDPDPLAIIVIDLESITIFKEVKQLARPVKKTPDQWEQEILNAAKTLFLSNGYEETSIADIMKLAGGAKGMFYRFFQSKEEVMQALGDRMFLENNPFDTLRERSDLNGLQKIRELLVLNRSDTEREQINVQAISILKDPRILSAAIAANRRVLTPLWRELLEEGCRDGSIQTEYVKELSELLPLINFWLLPSVYPADSEEICHKFQFIMEVLEAMGLPLMDEEGMEQTKQFFKDVSAEEE